MYAMHILIQEAIQIFTKTKLGEEGFVKPVFSTFIYEGCLSVGTLCRIILILMSRRGRVRPTTPERQIRATF